jgi:hypothetical protein
MELNAVANVAVRAGDLFAPVEGEQFDLIVANPPFVISPSRRYLFRDSEASVDDISRRIVRTAAEALRPGGHCQLLASWAHTSGVDWRQRLATWFDGTSCDALVIEREALEPAAHAASWLRQTEAPEQWDEFDEWVAYSEAHDIEAIGFGLISMRRRAAGPPWFRAETVTHELAMPCGDQLGAIFELADFLAVQDDRTLLDVVLEVPPGIVLDERSAPDGDGWRPISLRLRQTTGLRLDGEIDAAMAAIVAACDGRRPLGAVLADAANAAGRDLAEVRAGAVPIVRRLVEKAFLLPVVGAPG